MMERIFEEKEATNLKQVMNGLSYVTDDFTIARFIVESSFPEEFNDQMNKDPNCPEELKFNSSNVCNHFLSMYQKMYQESLLPLFEYFNQK